MQWHILVVTRTLVSRAGVGFMTTMEDVLNLSALRFGHRVRGSGRVASALVAIYGCVAPFDPAYRVGVAFCAYSQWVVRSTII